MKRVLAVAVLLMMLCTLSVSALFSEQITGISFQDMRAFPENHWSNRAVYTMAALGILKGSDGNFNPAGTTTRSEALAILMRGAGLEELAERTRKNILEQRIQNPSRFNGIDSWADGYVRLAVDYGIITVDTYNNVMAYNYPHDEALRTFKKEEAVTRLEFVEWFVRIFKLPLAEKADRITDYADYGTIPAEKQLYVETALRYGLMQGDGNGLGLARTISRQEVAQVLYNARALLCEKLQITLKDATVERVSTETVSANETALVTETTVSLSDGLNGTYRRTYAVVGAAVDYNDYFDTDTDILTLKKDKHPDGVHLLEKGDAVQLYYKQDNLLFLTADPLADEAPAETVDDSYIEGEPVNATLYYVDKAENRLILQKGKEMFEMPYMSGLTCVYRGKNVGLDSLESEYLDYPVTVFSAKSPSGSVYRAYHIQILQK